MRPGRVAGTDSPLVGEEPAPGGSLGQAVPARYRSTQTSGLRDTVAAGSNPPFDFQLTTANAP